MPPVFETGPLATAAPLLAIGRGGNRTLGTQVSTPAFKAGAIYQFGHPSSLMGFFHNRLSAPPQPMESYDSRFSVQTEAAGVEPARHSCGAWFPARTLTVRVMPPLSRKGRDSNPHAISDP